MLNISNLENFLANFRVVQSCGVLQFVDNFECCVHLVFNFDPFIFGN